MKLKNCPNCQQRISINDIECPYCKYIDDKKYQKENNKLKQKQHITVNYCTNCGTNLTKENKCCPKYEMDILKKEKENITKKNKKITKYGMIFNVLLINPFLILVILYIIQIHTYFFREFIPFIPFILCIILALIVIIIEKIKHPDNDDINVKFWISILILIIPTIGVTLMYFVLEAIASVA